MALAIYECLMTKNNDLQEKIDWVINHVNTAIETNLRSMKRISMNEARLLPYIQEVANRELPLLLKRVGLKCEWEVTVETDSPTRQAYVQISLTPITDKLQLT